MTNQQHECAPVEESGRPHLPVKEEIAGSKPVGRAMRTPRRPSSRRGVARDDRTQRSLSEAPRAGPPGCGYRRSRSRACRPWACHEPFKSPNRAPSSLATTEEAWGHRAPAAAGDRIAGLHNTSTWGPGASITPGSRSDEPRTPTVGCDFEQSSEERFSPAGTSRLERETSTKLDACWKQPARSSRRRTTTRTSPGR